MMVFGIMLIFIIAAKVFGVLKYDALYKENASAILLAGSLCAICFHQKRCLHHPSRKYKEKTPNKMRRHLCRVSAGSLGGRTWAEGNPMPTGEGLSQGKGKVMSAYPTVRESNPCGAAASVRYLEG